MTNFQGSLEIPVDGQRGYLNYIGSDTLEVGYILCNPAPSAVGDDAEKAQASGAAPSGATDTRFAGIVEQSQKGAGRVKVTLSGLAYVYVKDTTVVSGDFLVPDATDTYQGAKATIGAYAYIQAVEDSGASAGLVLCRVSQFPVQVA
jgi:hypothetical protein